LLALNLTECQRTAEILRVGAAVKNQRASNRKN
jgi:hypothetical protein